METVIGMNTERENTSVQQWLQKETILHTAPEFCVQIQQRHQQRDSPEVLQVCGVAANGDGVEPDNFNSWLRAALGLDQGLVEDGGEDLDPFESDSSNDDGADSERLKWISHAWCIDDYDGKFTQDFFLILSYSYWYERKQIWAGTRSPGSHD